MTYATTDVRPVPFSPAVGDLVRCRARDWFVEGIEGDLLDLRAVAGAGTVRVLPALEPDGVGPARFPLPPRDGRATARDARALADAARLSLRASTGPFASLGTYQFDPAVYQFVPLMLAEGQSTIRMLIADDVGIGKTVESGMILAEALARGLVERSCVVVPPHLVDQWVRQLSEKFGIAAVAVTPATLPALERDLALDESPFRAHPHTVVSLDHVKSDRVRDRFVAEAPPFVIVDEVHNAVGTGSGADTQRYALVRGLADDPDRHLVLVTATPHSGDDAAFGRLVGLLDREFARYPSLSGNEATSMRQRMARHVVQRRRENVKGDDARAFPEHRTADLPYELTGTFRRFHDDLLAWCRDTVARGERNPLDTVSVMQALGSSPDAARAALAGRALSAGAVHAVPEGDEVPGGLGDDEVDPLSIDDPVLRDLYVRSADLVSPVGRRKDPKAARLVPVLRDLLDEGFCPIVFCRFVPTAHAVAERLGKLGVGDYADVAVGVCTGRMTLDERLAVIAGLSEAPRRVLVTTDCLSEGIDLQGSHDAVLHYDIPWNPTRLAQRDGRVDRFGQPSEVVRSGMLHATNSRIDASILDVVVRKLRTIRERTGVRAVNVDERALTLQVLSEALAADDGQGELDLTADVPASETLWRDAREDAKGSRAMFAQNVIDPARTREAWDRARDVLGDAADAARFVADQMDRRDAAPTVKTLRDGKGTLVVADVDRVSPDLRDRLTEAGTGNPLRLAFGVPAPRAVPAGRGHPVVRALALHALEEILDAGGSVRSGAWSTAAVDAVTTVLVLRLRHRVEERAGTRTVEEVVTVRRTGRTGEFHAVPAAETFALLTAPAGDLSPALRDRTVARLVDDLDDRPDLRAIHADRAGDYARTMTSVLEAASRASPSRTPPWRGTVTPLDVPDVLGAYALLPPAPGTPA